MYCSIALWIITECCSHHSLPVVHTNTCGTIYDYEIQRNRSWCPVVPGTCGSRLWADCNATGTETTVSPLKAGSCTKDIILSACQGLVNVTMAGGTNSGQYNFLLNKANVCPEQLRDPRGPCFRAVHQVS